MALTIQHCDQLAAVDAASWDALNTSNNPFLSHRFLAGLEEYGCVTAEQGWQPSHILAFEQDQLIAALPRYLKAHSWGEFVFDFAWADAAQRAGLAYYPKSISALPFTPHNGPRLLGSNEQARLAVAEADWQASKQQGLSSSHWLFVNEADRQTTAELGWDSRRGVQYHWFNHDYSCFDDYLAAMTSKRRKQIRRERRQVTELGFRIEPTYADKVDPSLWPQIYALYCSSFLVRGQTPYYTEAFVQNVLPAMAEQCLLLLVFDADELIACAICFVDEQCLYGRHWGCTLAARQHSCLHFETCYYQGIQFCIGNGISRFEPGAQGEHKIWRGFEPVPTWSMHRMAHPGLHSAVANFIQEEARAMEQQQAGLAEHLPFRKG